VESNAAAHSADKTSNVNANQHANRNTNKHGDGNTNRHTNVDANGHSDKHTNEHSVMPAVSDTQQRLMGVALAVKRGEKKLADLPEALRRQVRQLLRTLSEKKLRAMATKKRENRSARRSGTPIRQASRG
jgi:hypothetical protein